MHFVVSARQEHTPKCINHQFVSYNKLLCLSCTYFVNVTTSIPPLLINKEMNGDKAVNTDWVYVVFQLH